MLSIPETSTLPSTNLQLKIKLKNICWQKILNDLQYKNKSKYSSLFSAIAQ